MTEKVMIKKIPNFPVHAYPSVEAVTTATLPSSLRGELAVLRSRTDLLALGRSDPMSFRNTAVADIVLVSELGAFAEVKTVELKLRVQSHYCVRFISADISVDMYMCTLYSWALVSGLFC